MTKQEQIEEMKKIMIKTCLGMRTVQEDYAQNNYAQALYNAGYRKVFLNKDNFTDLLNEEIKELSLIERTRKETAKEFAEKLKEKLSDKIGYDRPYVMRNIDETLKEYEK